MSMAEGEGLPRIEDCELIEPPVEVSPYRGGEQTSGWLSNLLPQGPSVSDRGFEPGLTYPQGRGTGHYQGHGGAWTCLRVGTAGDCCPETQLLFPRGCDVMGGCSSVVGLGP